MSTISIIFIVILICAELDFFALLFCREISDWLNARGELILSKAEAIRTNLRMRTPADTSQAQAYNEGYRRGYEQGQIKALMQEHACDDEEVYKKEGTE